jgi:hypothetical protein
MRRYVMEMKRSSIIEEMIKLSPLCSGTLHERYTTCGKKNCRCQDEEEPKLHGPYFIWIRVINGKQVMRTLRPGPDLERVKEGIENYHRFQALFGDLLRRDEESALSADRAIKDDGKKTPGGYTGDIRIVSLRT